MNLIRCAALNDRCGSIGAPGCLASTLALGCEVATSVESYVRADGIKVWSVMLFERQLRPESLGS